MHDKNFYPPIMATVQANKIIEYKYFNNLHYVQVEWNDKTVSWTRLNSLKNKELLYTFIKEAIFILRQEAKEEEEKIEKEKNERLLAMVMNDNIKSSAHAEEANARVFKEILKDTKIKNETSFLGIKKIQPLNDNSFFNKKGAEPVHKPSYPKQSEIKSQQSSYLMPEKKKIEMNFERPSMVSDYSRPVVKRPAISKMKCNTLIARVDDLQKLAIEFYFDEDFLPLCFESADLFYLNFQSVYPYLYSVFMSENRDFGIYPSIETNDQVYTELESTLRETGTLLAGFHKDFIWFVLTCKPDKYVFRHCPASKFLIIKIKKDKFISNLVQRKPEISQQNLWGKDTFKFGVDVLTDSLYEHCTFPSSKNIFIVGDSKTLSGQHLFKYSSFVGNITTNFLNADLVLIQEFYMPFLHYVPNFYDSLKTKTKFLLQSGTDFQEILVKGGFITFSDEFLEKAELLAVADLIEMIIRKPNWEIKVTRSLYNILKRKLVSQSTLPDYLHKMKLIYKTFKSNIVDCDEVDLICNLKRNSYRTHRHFIEVSSIKGSEFSHTIDEAIEIVISN